MIARQHRQDWWIGRTHGAMFFGRTSAEVLAKYAAWLRGQEVSFYDYE